MNDNAPAANHPALVAEARIADALQNEFPALMLPRATQEYPNGMPPGDAALEAIRLLYPIANDVVRGNISAAILGVHSAFPRGAQGLEGGRPPKTVLALSDTLIPQELRTIADAWDAEMKAMCQRMVQIAVSPTGSEEQKRQAINESMMRFMGVHARLCTALLRVIPPPA